MAIPILMMFKSTVSLSFLCFIFMLGSAAHAVVEPPPPVKWNEAADFNGSPKLMTYQSKVVDEVGVKTLQASAAPIAGARSTAETPLIAYTRFPVVPLPGSSAGISFEYKGNGTPFFGSVMVSKGDNLFLGYEAYFPLDSTEWRTMTVPWADLINNAMPWDKQARLSMNDFAFSPGDIKSIGFGRSNCNHKFYTPTFAFSVRNIHLVPPLPAKPALTYSKGLSHVSGLIQQKKPLNILLLGDSITDFGRDKSYGWHCAQLLQKKWGLPPCRVANTGIAGHSVRYGSIILPRSMRAMPQPDLVCILYGANDCKAATGEFNQSGFTEAVFAKNLSDMIDRVRLATNGKADIVLLSGVPRLDKKGGNTTGAVEKIAGAFKTVAAEKNVILCDTFPVFLALPPAQKNAYYMDTIHQTQPGLAAMGEVLFKTINASMTP